MPIQRRMSLLLLVLSTASLVMLAVFYLYAEGQRATAEARSDSLELGRTIADGYAEALENAGEVNARRFLEAVNVDRQSPVSFFWLDHPTLPEGVPAEALGLLSKGQSSTWLTSQSQLYAVVPMTFENRIGGIVIPDDLHIKREQVVSTVLTLLAFTAALGIASALVSAWMRQKFISAPMTTLVAMAEEVGNGHLDARVKLERDDEFKALGNALNSMAAQLQTARERLTQETESRLKAMELLRHADRLATVGKLAAGVAHELGTPLNVVLGRAKMVASGEVEGQTAREYARIVCDQVDHMTRIIRQLLDFARRREPRTEHTDLSLLANSSADMLRPLAAKRQVSLEVEAAPLTVACEPGAIQQVLSNLVLNATQAMPQGGTVQVTLREALCTPPPDVGGAAQRCAVLAVKDAGVGLSAEVREHLFEPFFTTKAVGEGTGLGLALSWGIARDHHGWIDVASEPGQGATFSLCLPLTAEKNA